MGRWKFIPVAPYMLSNLQFPCSRSLICFGDDAAGKASGVNACSCLATFLAVFMIWLAAGGNAEPELYPRPDGSVYICGESDSVGVPDDPLSIQPREDACDNLEVTFAHPLLSNLRLSKRLQTPACKDANPVPDLPEAKRVGCCVRSP